MILIKRGRVTFYISEDSIIVANGSFQYSAYSSFSTINKANFYKFREVILNSKPTEFTSIVDVVEQSSKYEVYSHSTSKPNLDGVEYERKD